MVTGGRSRQLFENKMVQCEEKDVRNKLRNEITDYGWFNLFPMPGSGALFLKGLMRKSQSRMERSRKRQETLRGETRFFSSGGKS